MEMVILVNELGWKISEINAAPARFIRLWFADRNAAAVVAKQRK